MKKQFSSILILVIVLFTIFSCKNENTSVSSTEISTSNSQDHPKLILTAQGVKDIRSQLGTIPIFDRTLEAVKAEIDAEIEAGIEVPIPLDYSGGYTHVRHKQNWFALQKAGLLYQILDDEKYENMSKTC